MRRSWKYSALLLVGLTGPVLSAEAQDIALPKYSVDVALSAKAAAKLVESGETIHIAAVYFGTARPGVQGDDVGQIPLGNEDTDIPAAGAAILGHIKLKSAEVAKIAEARPQLLINVYTSRKVFEDNLLDCGIFQDSVDVAAAKPIRIACKLIGE